MRHIAEFVFWALDVFIDAISHVLILAHITRPRQYAQTEVFIHGESWPYSLSESGIRRLINGNALGLGQGRFVANINSENVKSFPTSIGISGFHLRIVRVQDA